MNKIKIKYNWLLPAGCSFFFKAFNLYVYKSINLILFLFIWYTCSLDMFFEAAAFASWMGFVMGYDDPDGNHN